MADEKKDKPAAAVAAAEESPNRYTADVQERIARLKELIKEFSDEGDPRPALSTAEVRLARSTRPEAMENAARIVEEAVGISGNAADVRKLRDTIFYILAFASFRNALLAAAKLVDEDMLHKQLEAAKITRGIYRTAKGFVTLDAGDAIKTYVADLKSALVRPRRKRKVATEGGAPPEGGVVAEKK